ncbi:MAG: DUF3592 domain-containing protein [Terracidiphilus sp.]
MGGFFLDSVISSIIKKVRTNSRVSTAEDWLLAEGKVRELNFRERGSSRVAYLNFTYEVDGETHYGSAECSSINESQEGIATESTNALQTLVVRYNPADPLENRLLNEDNPKLRLSINHEPY